MFREEALREHVTQLKKGLRAYDIKSLRLISFTTTLPEYNKVLNVFETFNSRISKIGSVSREERLRIQGKIVNK